MTSKGRGQIAARARSRPYAHARARLYMRPAGTECGGRGRSARVTLQPRGDVWCRRRLDGGFSLFFFLAEGRNFAHAAIETVCDRLPSRPSTDPFPRYSSGEEEPRRINAFVYPFGQRKSACGLTRARTFFLLRAYTRNDRNEHVRAICCAALSVCTSWKSRNFGNVARKKKKKADIVRSAKGHISAGSGGSDKTSRRGGGAIFNIFYPLVTDDK